MAVAEVTALVGGQVIDGNPLEYLADMRRVKHIIKDGEITR